jgi:hypothetical protein
VNNLTPFKAACEEVYSAPDERLYNRRTTPGQIRKMYDAFTGGC